MKDAIKLLLEIIKLGKAIFKAYKKEKNVRKKKAIRKAIQKRDLVRLLELNLGRLPDKRK